MILVIIMIFFLIIFFLNKEFRFNVAVRFIVFTNVNPFCERYYNVSIWDDNIHIKKQIYTYYKDENEFILYEKNKKFERMKKSLQTSLKINESIYNLQCSDFWSDNKRAIYIDSDSYVGGGLATLSVGTGHGSYEIDTYVDLSYEEKWVIVRNYIDKELQKEFEQIVLRYGGYEFKVE